MQQFGMQQPPEIEKRSDGLKIIVVAVILFALAGLMMGLAVGAFTRTHTPSQSSSIAQQRPSPTASTQNVNVATLGISCPTFNPTPFTQIADGATSYQLSAAINDKTIPTTDPCGKGKPLQAPGIMCKLWLATNDQATLRSLTRAQFFPVSNMGTTFPGEVQNALTFAGGQQQVQQCSTTGTTTWSYRLSPTVQPGTYFLAVAADWQGQAWNWSWRQITVQGH